MPVEIIGRVVVFRVGLIRVEIDSQIDTEFLPVQLCRRIPVELQFRHLGTLVLFFLYNHLAGLFPLVHQLVDAVVSGGHDRFTHLHLQISRTLTVAVGVVLRIIRGTLGVHLGDGLRTRLIRDVVNVDITHLMDIIVLCGGIVPRVHRDNKMNHILARSGHRIVILLFQIVVTVSPCIGRHKAKRAQSKKQYCPPLAT